MLISVSNHNGETFTNFQVFAITDFDNLKYPESAKIPAEKYCKALEGIGIDGAHYLFTESGMKGYHVWVFFDEAIPSTTVEKFQAKVFELCGFQQTDAHKWLYLPDGYDRSRPLDEQDHTVVETLAALGEGLMLKALFSMHPKNHERFELPYTLEKALARRTSDPQTDEDFAEAEAIIRGVCRAEDALIDSGLCRNEVNRRVRLIALPLTLVGNIVQYTLEEPIYFLLAPVPDSVGLSLEEQRYLAQRQEAWRQYFAGERKLVQ